MGIKAFLNRKDNISMKARTITRPGRSNYYIMLDYTDENGKRKQKLIATDIPIKGNNRRAIEERRKEIEAEYENLDPDLPTEPIEVNLRGDILFTDYLLQWLETQRIVLADSTFQLYEYQVNSCIIPWFSPKERKLKELTCKDIVEYTNDMLKKVSGNTVRKYLTNISKCLASAASEPNYFIPFNPAKAVTWPKKQEFMGAEIYDADQIVKLLEVSKGDPLELMILMTVYYGLRRSEVLGLKWDAVNFSQKKITIKRTVTRIVKAVVNKVFS